uniref:hypothetical protein n=2 Tax=Bradyrhizobium TaxID=374 RepID=UPI001AEC4AFF|nr:hypothetical protein [Bradyrhizobium sp.]
MFTTMKGRAILMADRFVVRYEHPKNGRFTVLDTSIDQPAVTPDGTPLTGLSHSTAEVVAENLNKGDAPPALNRKTGSRLRLHMT